MDSQMVPKGMEFATAAVTKDQEGKWEEALSLYTQALQHLVTGIKYIKNARIKAAIDTKAAQYMGRAEEIKKLLAKQSDKTVIHAGAGGNEEKEKKGGDDDGEEEGDAELAKLAAQLQGVVVSELPNVKWDDVAGLFEAKKLLKEAVITPVMFPQLFTGKVKPWKGILMYGPPGTGKSYLAKAVATEAGSSCFLSCSSSDLVSKYQGESERLVKVLFAMARKKAPAIIFIDEIDSLCGSRSEGENDSARRIKTEFLNQMDGVGRDNKGVLVLGATNTPWEIDPAMRRRFEKRVYIPLPDEAARLAMYKIHIGKTPHAMKEKDFKALSKTSDGYSGADLSIVVREALIAPIRKCQDATHFKKIPDPEGKEEFLWQPCSPGDADAEEKSLYDCPGHLLKPPVAEVKDFQIAQKKTKASVGHGDLKRYEDWTKEFGMEG